MDLPDQLQLTLGDTYTIERELGGGGMSRVFVAKELALGRQVVIKVLPPEMAAQTRTKPYLLVSSELKTSRRVTYCSNSRPQFKKDLVLRLLRKSRRPRP